MDSLKTSLELASSLDTLVVSDSDALNAWLVQEGRRAMALLELDALPEQCIVLSFSTLASRHTFRIARNAPSGRRIFCALHVFEPSIDHAKYALRMMAASHFSQAVENQRPVLEQLNSARHFILEHKGKSAGALMLRDNAVAFATLAEDLQGSYIRSVAEFFEIHYAHTNRDTPCPFSFSGVLEVVGVLLVLRDENFEGMTLKGSLDELVQSVALHGATAVIENNAMNSFIVQGREYIDLLVAAAGERGASLTEFAVGVNRSVSSKLDYAVNPQLNEGVAGIHVAVGDGRSGFHIDFLCPNYKLKSGMIGSH